MSLTLSWSVTGIKTRDQVNSEGATLANAVVQTYWKVVGTDADGNTGEFSGATPFSAENVPEGSFVALEALTEETVLDWIRAVVVGDYYDHVVGIMQKQIDDAVVQEPSLPWAPPEPEAPATE